MRLDVVGANHNFYIDKEVTGSNCDFDYINAEFNSNTIFFIAENNDKYALKLWLEEGECGSGWCAASYGFAELTMVKGAFQGINLLPTKKMTVDMNELLKFKDIGMEGKVILCNEDNDEICIADDTGGDDYYPSGGFYFNDKLFHKTPRTIKTRRTYIVKGPGGIGKSFLTKSITDLKVYETDIDTKLPDTLIYDVVVLGNRSGFSVEDIKNKLNLDTTEVVVVDMKYEIGT